MVQMPLRDGDPSRIGGFRLVARLGAGGMGVVYLATAKDGTQVAVKVLRAELDDDADFRRTVPSRGRAIGTRARTLHGASHRGRH